MKKPISHLPLEKAIRRITGSKTTTKGFPLLRSLMRATLTALGHHPAAAEATLEQLLIHWRRVGIAADQVADLRARNLAMPRRGLRPSR
jgi:muconolactone delta-isomerase